MLIPDEIHDGDHSDGIAETGFIVAPEKRHVRRHGKRIEADEKVSGKLPVRFVSFPERASPSGGREGAYHFRHVQRSGAVPAVQYAGRRVSLGYTASFPSRKRRERREFHEVKGRALRGSFYP